MQNISGHGWACLISVWALSWISIHFTSWKVSTLPNKFPKEAVCRRLLRVSQAQLLHNTSDLLPIFPLLLLIGVKMFAICFSRGKETFSLWCLLCNLVNVECFLLWPVQVGLYSPAGSISLLVIALLESVLLETKLHRVNGLYGASGDIQVIMISFGVRMEVRVSYIWLFSPNKCHLLWKHTFIFIKVGLLFVPSVHVLYTV